MTHHTPEIEYENAKIGQELAQREAELTIINSIQQGLAARLDVQAIYDLVGDEIRDIFNAQVVMISPYDQKTNTIEHRYAIERGLRVYSPGSHLPGGFRSKIIHSGQPLLVNTDVAEQAALLGQPTLPGTKTPKSWLGVPMIVRGQVTGVLSLQNVDQENAFGESDVRLLQTITASMSVALENARLFEKTQCLLKESEQRAAELQIINSVQQGLAQKLDAPSIYELVGEKIRETFAEKAETIFIAFHDVTTAKVNYRYMVQAHVVHIESGWYPDNLLKRMQIEPHYRTVCIRSAADLAIPGSTLAAPGSAILVPLIVSEEKSEDSGLSSILGVVGVLNCEREYAFSDSDVRLLETLSNSMSVALENARLWEQEKQYRKALEREFEIGREIQAGFLPDCLPQLSGWEIAASLKSAREVAGDFYDVFELPEGKIGLVIADVCDKGLGAALFMTLFRSLLRAFSNTDFFTHAESDNLNTPTTRLKNAISLTNNYIVETHGDTGMFATIFFGILDIETGILTYINGGHIPPLLINQNGIREILKTSGPAVGVVSNMDYRVGKIRFELGDTLFAYTDGLTDATNQAGESVNINEFISLLTDALPLNAQLEKCQKRVAAQSAGTKQFDDITILVVRRIGLFCEKE